MPSDRWHAALVIGLVLGLLAGFTLGRSSRAASPPSPTPIVDWTPLGTPLPESSIGASAEAEPSGVPQPAQVTDAPSVPLPTNGPTPNVSKPAPSPRRAAASVSGLGSWYCSSSSPCTRGYPASSAIAAAGPRLRSALGTGWRGRSVVVSANGRSVRLTLRDWCACPSRLIDIYASQFARLAPLSAGLITVRVSW